MLSHTLILEIGIAVGLVAIVGLIANKLKFSVIPFFHYYRNGFGSTCTADWIGGSDLYRKQTLYRFYGQARGIISPVLFGTRIFSQSAYQIW